MKVYILMGLLVPFLSNGQSSQQAQYVTTDIANFWQMFDRLKQAKTQSDTLGLIKSQYLSKASSALRQYLAIAKTESNTNVPLAYLKMIRQ